MGDTGVYVCLLINSLMEVDKTVRYDSAKVNIVQQQQQILNPTDNKGTITSQIDFVMANKDCIL